VEFVLNEAMQNHWVWLLLAIIISLINMFHSRETPSLLFI